MFILMIKENFVYLVEVGILNTEAQTLSAWLEKYKRNCGWSKRTVYKYDIIWFKLQQVPKIGLNVWSCPWIIYRWI